MITAKTHQINKFIEGKRTSSFYAHRNNQKKKTEDIDFIEIKITYYYQYSIVENTLKRCAHVY